MNESNNKSNVIVSWSGGKDCCLACYKAIKEGYNVAYLYNTISKEYHRVRFHGFKEELVQKQAQAIGVPLVQIPTVGDNYEKDFKNGLRRLIEKNNISAMVFGDIHLEDGLKWVNKVCKELGIAAIEPIWKMHTKDILLDFIDSGFSAIVTSCQGDKLDKSYIGRKIDRKFLEDISKLDIDLCGENGEYHTLVIDGPIFKQRIEIQESQNVLRDGYWFLDIRKCKLIKKFIRNS